MTSIPARYSSRLETRPNRAEILSLVWHAGSIHGKRRVRQTDSKVRSALVIS